jgi:hypothetical protein
VCYVARARRMRIFINGRDESRLAKAVAQIDRDRCAGHSSRRRHQYGAWPRGADCSLPGAGHSGEQQRGTAAWRAGRLGSRSMAVGPRGQHAGARSADPRVAASACASAGSGASSTSPLRW